MFNSQNNNINNFPTNSSLTNNNTSLLSTCNNNTIINVNTHINDSINKSECIDLNKSPSDIKSAKHDEINNTNKDPYAMSEGILTDSENNVDHASNNNNNPFLTSNYSKDELNTNNLKNQ